MLKVVENENAGPSKEAGVPGGSPEKTLFEPSGLILAPLARQRIVSLYALEPLLHAA